VADVLRYQLGGVRLSRVSYFDVALSPGTLGLTVDQVQQVAWAVPTWAQPDGQVLVGQAVWVIESDGVVMVVDPCGAADAFIRTGKEAIGHQEAVLGALAAAGFPAERVDVVLLSHLDGIGMAAIVEPDGDWLPAFPRARVILTDDELRYLAGARNVMGLTALNALRDQGVVDGVHTPHSCMSGVTVALTGAHTPGHAVVRIDAGGHQGVLLGHLALNPAHLATGPCLTLHDDPAGAARVLEELLIEASLNRALVCGPLWPAPGAGYVSGPPWVLTPASPTCG
jgi:glyoxylase-like metal-dependent hydrolase (beta-lactamase superfamily II)